MKKVVEPRLDAVFEEVDLKRNQMVNLDGMSSRAAVDELKREHHKIV